MVMNIREQKRWPTYSNYPSQIKRGGSDGWEAVFGFLSLSFFSFWMQMVSETLAFWLTCCLLFFILILERFAGDLSDVVRFHDPLCEFIWGQMVVFMLCALCVCFLCPVQQTELCEPYNVCSYLIFFPWPFTLYVFVCVSMKHFVVYVFVCGYQR